MGTGVPSFLYEILVELFRDRPALRGELERRLQGQPEARLVQLIAELARVDDEDEVRAALDRRE